MRAKKGLIIQKIDEDFYLIDSGEELPRFNGMVKLNDTSHFIMKCLIENEMQIEDLYNAFMKEYDVSLETLKSSVPQVINELKKINVII